MMRKTYHSTCLCIWHVHPWNRHFTFHHPTRFCAGWSSWLVVTVAMAVIFATNRPRPGEITIGPSAVVSKIFWAEAMASQNAILCCECQATRTVASAAPSVSVESFGLTKQSNYDFWDSRMPTPPTQPSIEFCCVCMRKNVSRLSNNCCKSTELVMNEIHQPDTAVSRTNVFDLFFALPSAESAANLISASGLSQSLVLLWDNTSALNKFT